MEIHPLKLKEKDFKSVHKALIRFYEKRPDDYGEFDERHKEYENYSIFINKFIPAQNAKILDVGSGSWRIPDTIAKFGYKEVIGLDYFSQEKMIEFSKNISNSNARLVCYNDDKIPFPDGYFDCVTSLCVLEHIVYIKESLDEMDRVLKPGGLFIIQGPNWSGINPAISAIFHTLLNKGRFWQYRNFFDSITGIFRSIGWYLEVLLSSKPKFILVEPRMKDGEINFERSDDDAVHLCQPLSYKKYFIQKKYKIIKYNHGYGTTFYTYLFNYLLPSMASSNVLVFKKNN